MSFKTEFEAYRSTVKELETSVIENKKYSPVKRLFVRSLAETIGVMFHPVVRLFNSPKKIIADNKRLMEGHKDLI